MERLWELQHLVRAAYKAMLVAEHQNDLNAIETARKRYYGYRDEQKKLLKETGELTF